MSIFINLLHSCALQSIGLLYQYDVRWFFGDGSETRYILKDMKFNWFEKLKISYSSVQKFGYKNNVMAFAFNI